MSRTRTIPSLGVAHERTSRSTASGIAHTAAELVDDYRDEHGRYPDLVLATVAPGTGGAVAQRLEGAVRVLDRARR